MESCPNCIMEAQCWDWPLQHNDGMVDIVNDNEHFEANLEMPTFKPSDIEVKIRGKNEFIIHCSHNSESNCLPREIYRIYHLPMDIDVHTVKTYVRPNGMLQVKANKKHM